MRHTTTDRKGKRTYRTNPKNFANYPHKALYGANEKGQKILTRHIWQEHLDLAEQLRKTERGKGVCPRRKETIERLFGDAKKKRTMRYSQHRGLTRVAQWVRLKYVAMNLKIWQPELGIALAFLKFTIYLPFIYQKPQLS
ncbi:MAG: hypothetical protein GX025_02085 [Clostridiales bacterium]|nr:hypothetical protein [Clostridiales bacterium]